MTGRKPFLLHLVSSGKWGDSEKGVFDISRYLIEKNLDVSVMTRDAIAVDRNFQTCGIPLCHAPFCGGLDIDSVNEIRRQISARRNRDIIIHAYTRADASLAVWARIFSRHDNVRVILTHNDDEPGYPWLFSLRQFLSIDCHTFPSALALERYKSLHPAIFSRIESRSVMLPQSVYRADNSILAMPERGPVSAMFQGEITPGSGLETLIDAMSLVRPVKLRLKIVGTGNPDYIDFLRRRAMTRGVMEMIDWTRSTDPCCSLFRDCHFGVVPSVRSECNSLVNKEFMAYARPQVSTFLGAQKEYMTENEDAFFVPPADPPALAERMKALASSPDLRSDMGKSAYRHFQAILSWQTFIDRLTDLYLHQ